MELARAFDHRNRGLTMHINKVHAVRTLALVAKELGEDVDWLADIAIDLEPEDGLIWVYVPEHPDETMAFSQFGIESLCNLIEVHRSTRAVQRSRFDAADARFG